MELLEANVSSELEQIAIEYDRKQKMAIARVIVCAGTECIAKGAYEIYKQLLSTIEAKGVRAVVDLTISTGESDFVHLSKSGCQGFCHIGPLLRILPHGILYTRVKLEDVNQIVDDTLIKGQVINRLLYKKSTGGDYCRDMDQIPFYQHQERLILKDCGLIDPEDIHEYIYRGGYRAARRAYLFMSSDEIISEVERSGLRGRGGAGFPTGKKWRLARVKEAQKKYVICNGDEGDPGAFMDRGVMEGNPHSIIEGMLIAARAIGADEGYIYVRMEYPLAVERLRKAVKAAEDLGFVGDNVFGSKFAFQITVMEGAGAFVCGEETALIASIEGRRGMPSPKPPFPVESGLFGRPTVINNVETLANLPIIFKLGADTYAKKGTQKSAGTKTFSLSGHVLNTGLIEVPFGTTLRKIIFDIGGGVIIKNRIGKESDFKAVQIGGPSGVCLSARYLDLPVDFDSLAAVNGIVGSGGLVVMNRETCMVQVARYFMEFAQRESCGKCVPCREGTYQMLLLLDDIINGKGTEKTLTLLETLANAVKLASLCGLGKTAPNPVLSMLRDFRGEFEAHVIERRCPAKKCKALIHPRIDPQRCKGCGLCVKVCPTGAITGERKKPFVINEDICIKCGECYSACNLDAIL